MRVPDRLDFARAKAEAIFQQRTVGQLRQRIVQRPMTKRVGRCGRVLPSLGVEDVRRGDIGEDLASSEFLGAELLVVRE